MERRVIAVALLLLLPTCVVGQQLTHKLTNQDVIRMVSVGMSDAVVIQKIQTSEGTDFDTSVKALENLKAAHVSDAIIRIMLDPHQPYASTSPNPYSLPSSGELPLEVGVYILEKGRTVEVEPEIVGWQSGGVLKTIGTLGFDKGHINGTVMRSTSSLRLASPVEFIVRPPEGTSATEYQLLRLYQKGDRREFRALTGGVFHRSGGAKRNAVSFDPVKIGTHTWRFIVALPRGEYGLLPPGISAASIASNGKIYTFAVIEGPTDSAFGNSTFSRNGDSNFGTSTEGDIQTAQDQGQNERRSSTELLQPSQQHNERAWLGASSQDRPMVRHNGITLSTVDRNGPAYEGGLQSGDVILKVDGAYVYTVEDLAGEIQKHAPGAKVEVEYLRGVSLNHTSVVLGKLARF